MPSLKAIRKRIGSVKNTRKITRAMKLVAAAKLRRAQDAIIAARPYANALSNVVVFPMVMIGGAFFPFEAMPEWMRAVGAWTPNGLALVRFKEIVAGTATLPGVLGSALAIGVPAAVLFLLSSRLAGGRFASRD